MQRLVKLHSNLMHIFSKDYDFHTSTVLVFIIGCNTNTDELGYNVMKGTEYFVSL